MTLEPVTQEDKPEYTTLSARMRADLAARFERECTEVGISVSEAIRQLIRQYLRSRKEVE